MKKAFAFCLAVSTATAQANDFGPQFFTQCTSQPAMERQANALAKLAGCEAVANCEALDVYGLRDLIVTRCFSLSLDICVTGEMPDHCMTAVTDQLADLTDGISAQFPTERTEKAIGVGGVRTASLQRALDRRREETTPACFESAKIESLMAYGVDETTLCAAFDAMSQYGLVEQIARQTLTLEEEASE